MKKAIFPVILTLTIINFTLGTGIDSSGVPVNNFPQNFSNQGIGGGGYTYSPSISPHDPNHIFIACDMAAMYRSTDAAQSWSMVHYQQKISRIKAKVQFTSNPQILYSTGRSSTNLDDPWFRGELIKSTDGGINWQIISDPTATGIHRLEVDPSSTQRMILNEYDRLFFTSNGGTSWTQVDFQQINGDMWLGGAVWDGQNIFIATNHGLLVSHNGGASFSIENHSGLPSDAGIYQLAGAKSGNTLRLFCITAPSSMLQAWNDVLTLRGNLNGMFKMDYSPSANWTNSRGNIPAEEEIAWVDMAATNTQTIWSAAQTSDSQPRVYKSTDGGTTWTNTYLLQNNQNVATGWAGNEGAFWLAFTGAALGFDVSPTDPNRVIVADGTGHITTDGGATWKATYVNPSFLNSMGQPSTSSKFYKTSGLDVTTSHHVFWKNDTEIFVCQSDIGQTYSADGGDTWTFGRNIFYNWGPGSPISNNNWYRIVQQPSTGHLFAGVSDLNDLYQDQRISDSGIDGQGLVAKSTDGGVNWDTIHYFGKPVVWLEIDQLNPAKIYASVAGQGIYQSINGGSTWTILPSPPRTENRPYNLISLLDGSLVASYAAREDDNGILTESSGVFLLTPGSNIWLDRSDEGMRYFTKDITIDPHDPTQSTWYAAVWGRYSTFSNPNDPNSTNGGIYRTTNRGQTWTRIYQAFQPQSLTIHPSIPGTAYLAIEYNGLFYTENLGATPTFERVTSYPYFRPNRVFFKPGNDHEIWITSMGGGLWKGFKSPSTSVLPDGFESLDIFPNPSSGAFYLKIKTINNKSLKINILNALGQLIDTRGANLNPGETTLFFDRQNMPSGTYFLEIWDNGQSTILKVLITE